MRAWRVVGTSQESIFTWLIQIFISTVSKLFQHCTSISCIIIVQLDVIYRAGLLKEEHLTVKPSLALQFDR